VGVCLDLTAENSSAFGASWRYRVLLGRSASHGERPATAKTGDRGWSHQPATVGTSRQCVYLKAAVRTGMCLVANLRIALRTRNQHTRPSLQLVCVWTECLVRPKQTGLSASCLLSSFHGMECSRCVVSFPCEQPAAPKTTSKTSLNSSIMDGSQDCLFAPISTT
jgi:hypothetical protein